MAAYDKVLIDDTGEEYPYSEDIGDDGSMLDFGIAPKHLFPNREKLAEEDLLNLMNFMCFDKIKHHRKYYSPKEVADIRAAYDKHINPAKQN